MPFGEQRNFRFERQVLDGVLSPRNQGRKAILKRQHR